MVPYADFNLLKFRDEDTISELATQRSEFSAVLRSQGVDGLIAVLNRKAATTGAVAARS